MPEQDPPYTKLSREELESLLLEHEKWLNTNGREGSRVILENLNLSKGFLTEISFSLNEKNLSKALIKNVHFGGSYLENLNLSGAILNGAIFNGANLNKSNFAKAKCFNCSFDHPGILAPELSHSTSIQNAELINSTFEKCGFKKARFDGSDLKNSDFSQCNFEEATLLGAKLNESNFQDSNFEKVTGLLGSQFAGANISGAKIPVDIRKFEGLTRIEELSKKAGKLFILMLVGCLYSWLTIATTTDSQLFLNSKHYDLPVIQTAIPITPFFYVAPLILLGIYIWFHLYLQRLWEEMAILPAIFPDGKPLDQKVFPWLLSGFVRAYIPLLQKKLPDLFWLQFIASLVLAWCLTPFILSQFWIRVLPTHDGILMFFLGSIFSIALGFGIYFFSLTRITLYRNPQRPKILLISLAIGICFIGITDQINLAVIGITKTQPWSNLISQSKHYIGRQERPHTPDYPENYLWLTNIGNKILKITENLGLRTYAEFQGEELTKIPAYLNGDLEDISKVRGTYWGGKNLRFTRVETVFLVNSNFSAANLSHAYFLSVDLRGSSFERANLTGALLAVNLKEGNFLGANLTNTNLQGKYQKVDFRGANLEKAFILRSNMQQALFAGTNFQAAIIDYVDFEGANFSGPYPSFKDPKNFPNFGHFEPVEGAANFSYATLVSVSFKKTNIQGVEFTKTKFFDVDLSEAKGLTQAQIDEACVDEKTKLPPGIKRPDPCP